MAEAAKSIVDLAPPPERRPKSIPRRPDRIDECAPACSAAVFFWHTMLWRTHDRVMDRTRLLGSKKIRDALRRIDELLAAKSQRDRADCLKIGEAWYQIKDDPSVRRGDLKKLAPDFRHDPGTLQKFMRLYAEQHLLADADAWAVASNYKSDWGFEPFHSLYLLKNFKVSLRTSHSGSDSTRNHDPNVPEPHQTDPITILTGDCRVLLHGLPGETFNCCVTSPPYYHARDYGHDAQIGLEQTVADYVFELVQVFREIKRVLRKDGVCFIVIDDRWAGRAQTDEARTWYNYGRVAHPADKEPRKGLIGVPDTLRTALRRDGWLIRSNIIWLKTHGNFESVRDRPTHAYQTVVMLTKSERYWYNSEAREPSQQRPTSQQLKRGRLTVPDKNITDVWAIAPEINVDHPAPFPAELARNCIVRACPVGGQIIDPFSGSGTVGVVARMLDMRATLMELNPEFVELSRQRIAAVDTETAAAE